MDEPALNSPANREPTRPKAEQRRPSARRPSPRPASGGRNKDGQAAKSAPPSLAEAAPTTAPRPLWQQVQEAQQAVTLLRQELASSSRANADSSRSASATFFTYTAQLHQELDTARAHLAELKLQQTHDDGAREPAAATADGHAVAAAGPRSPLSLARGEPPAAPDAWAKADADLGAQVSLRDMPGEPYQGARVCACGGIWRYTLAGSDTRPIWRCLHCGAVQQGER